MRISFEAPPGFSLTNSPQAIGLSGPGGIAGEFGGSAARGDLRSYAEALVAHVVGDAPAEVTAASATVINGLPAVITQIRMAVGEGTVPLAIAVYDGGGGQFYHFIIASPPADADATAIAALFRSFRRLSAEEAAALRPRFVRAIRATADDTPETLIRRIADPAPRALFELLNGRRDDRPLTPGETVKIVTYAEGRLR